MSRIMNLIISVVVIFFFNSCNQIHENNQSLMENENIITRLDSISIKYWKSTEANEYYFKYSNNIIQISSQYFSINKKLSKDTIVSRFLNYIDVLFITKTQDIVVKKEKAQEPIITDYPVLTVQGYKSGKEIINQTIQIGKEEYDIEYNPMFVEFYEFLDELVTDK